ncbi:unnamed protein product, partial [marine sediment metagenome]
MLGQLQFLGGVVHRVRTTLKLSLRCQDPLILSEG